MRDYIGQQVECYLNLVRTKKGETHAVWSVRAKVRGDDGKLRKKVIGYARQVRLSGCRFHVSEATRQRVIRNKERCIHAWVVGTFESFSDVLLSSEPSTDPVSYNPYKEGYFYHAASKQPITEAEHVVCSHRCAYITGEYYAAK